MNNLLEPDRLGQVDPRDSKHIDQVGFYPVLLNGDCRPMLHGFTLIEF